MKRFHCTQLDIFTPT